MLNYLVRRLLLGAVTLFLVTFIMYGVIRNMPGDPLLMQLVNANPDKPPRIEDIERQRKIFHLDRPWYVGYVLWLKQIPWGVVDDCFKPGTLWERLGRIGYPDLGPSISRNAPVSRIITEKIPATLLLTVSSLILTYVLAIPLGLYSTVRQNHIDERLTSTGLYMMYSLPSFVAALLLQILFAVRLEGTMFELPLWGLVSDDYKEFTFWGKVWDLFLHSILPVTCYTYASLAYYSRFIRANMQEVIRQDYIRTARAKGVGPLRVLVHHAFRNTLIPLVTLIGLTLPVLLSGSIILETIFGWPGMGKLYIESMSERDYPTIMGLTLMFSVLTLAGQLLADFFYALVDPRVTYN